MRQEFRCLSPPSPSLLTGMREEGFEEGLPNLRNYYTIMVDGE